MPKIKLNTKTKLLISNIEGFLKRKVVPVGNSAKVSCPKEYIGKVAYLIIIR